MSAASSVNNRARSVRSVFVVAVEPAGETAGEDVPLVLDDGRAGDVLPLFLVEGAGAPKRVFDPEDKLSLGPEALPPGPPLRKLPGVENDGGEGV